MYRFASTKRKTLGGCFVLDLMVETIVESQIDDRSFRHCGKHVRGVRIDPQNGATYMTARGRFVFVKRLRFWRESNLRI